MIEIPDVNKIIVFNSGIINGLNVLIPVGGHLNPNSMIWVNLKWKKLQKNEIKKSTSEIINKIIPIFIPLNTLKECHPCNVLSRIISRHHWYIINNKIINVKITIIDLLLKFLIIVHNKIINLIDLITGHGL